MIKSELVEYLSQTQSLPKGRAELLVDTIFECLTQALARGERIEIRGFGSFEIRSYKAYEGRNPRTGERVEVKPKRLPFFKVGKELRDRVDGNARKAAEPPAVASVTPPASAAPLASAHAEVEQETPVVAGVAATANR